MIETIFVIAIVVIEIAVIELRRDSYCVVTLKNDVFAEGKERKTLNGYRFCAYTGIPYARSKRFELPRHIPLWKGKKKFTDEAKVCVQMSYETHEVIGSEDCLFLNVYTIMRNKLTSNESNNLLPVLFYIHGGSFNVGWAGSDLNQPDYFLEKGIVVVTINYRLGPFGFLSYPNVTRNIGLHDQRMALKWIHKNIFYFGGNRSKISLAGWSSGGASVSYHMFAKKSKELFDKAIMMSGNMLNPWAFESDVVRCTYELIKELNIQNSAYAIDDLKVFDAYDLIPPIFSDELKINFFGSEQFCFVPTIDNEFVTQSPHIISYQQSPSNVPMLIGTTSLESEWIMSFESNYFKYPNENVNISNFINAFMKSVFERDSGNNEKERFIRSFQHASDMSYGVYKFIRNYVDRTKQEKVFVYQFAADDKFRDLEEDNANIGAVHGDELKYIFKDSFLDENSKDFLNESLIKQRMITMWSNFIKFGNPTPNDDDISFNLTWPPFNFKEQVLLNIDNDMTVVQLNDNSGAFQLWDTIYQCMYNFQCDLINEYLYHSKMIEF